MNKELNSVVQIIVQQAPPSFSHMVAGTGWFPKHEAATEGTIVTNAHVVRGARAVYIRLPCAHSIDIQASVRGISTDLDIAVIELQKTQLEQVKAILGERYGDTTIPKISLGDSDAFLAAKPEEQQVVARGNPLGNEYQNLTGGRLSGLKHAHEQLYLVTDASINPGNSGGPALNKAGQVVGMNTMKVNGATEINMLIPINRIKRVLPELMNNTGNEVQVQKWMQLAQMAFSKVNAKGEEPTKEQLQHVASTVHSIDIDIIKLKSKWEEHKLGGLKRISKHDTIPVSFSDFYMKHCYKNDGAHHLLEHIFDHIKEDNIQGIHQMRSKGFQNFTCEDCAHNTAPITAGMIPPRVLHYPRLAFKTSNSTGLSTLNHYGNPKGVESGVIVSDVIKGGLMHRSGLQKYDFIYNITTPEGSFDIDNYGETWMSNLRVSIPINDIIHRTNFGKQVEVNIIRECDKKKLTVDYTFLKQEFKPHVRNLDSLQDMPLTRLQANMAGITVTPLRMNHVMQFKLGNYLNPHKQNEFKVVVNDVAVGTPAFHSRNIVPGDILSKVNKQPIADSWKGFVKQMKSIQKNVVLETERGSILIL